MAEPFSYEEHELTLADVKAMLKDFERQYGMTSEEFLEKWKNGKANWVAESVVWRGLLDSYQALNGRNEHPPEA